MYTELINQCVVKEEDRQQVFDASGDQVLIAGGTHEEVTIFKNTEVLKRVAESVAANGNQPGLFAGIIRRAIMLLKQFLDFLMNVTAEDIAKLMAAEERGQIKESGNDKGPRPDSSEQELRFMKADAVHQKLYKCNRKLYALQNEKHYQELSLESMTKSIFKIKERKALEKRIDGLQRQIKSTREQLELIPRQNGFNNVKEVEAEYKAAKAELKAIRQKQDEWDGVKPVVEVPEPQTLNQKKSVLQALAAKQMEVETRKQQSHDQKRGRNGVKNYESL